MKSFQFYAHAVSSKYMEFRNRLRERSGMENSLSEDQERHRPSIRQRGEKVKIALIPDRHGWAFDHICGQLTAALSDEFDFKVIYMIDAENVITALREAEDCDILHFFWRGELEDYYSPYCQVRIRMLGMREKTFRERYIEGKYISTEIYDHLLLSGAPMRVTMDLFAEKKSLLSGYAVSSWKLKKIYDELPGITLRPAMVLPDGVDLKLFRPAHLERFETIASRTVRIGWVGNSSWRIEDLKGINTIIRPAVAELRAEGFDVELIASDRIECLLPHEEMPAFYEGIDLYVCASLFEGTPNPVLESMACGVPVISTDVGLVQELFGSQQKQFILEERSVECLKEKIRILLREPERFKQLSEENLFSIQEWSWEKMIPNFRTYFRKCIEENSGVSE